MGTGSRPALAGFPALESGLGRLPIVATQQGLIPVVHPVPEGLKQAGMYMPNRLENQILAVAGSHRDAQARALVPSWHPTRGRNRDPQPTSRPLAAEGMTSTVPDTNGTPLSLTHWALRCYGGKHRYID